MSKLFKPYEGKRPYLFISYPHKQSDQVIDTIRILHDQGYRLWYDEGIPAGSDWPANIAQHMRDCEAVICFISDHFLKSQNCFSEVRAAVHLKKPILILYLEDIEPDERWKPLLQNRPVIPVLDSAQDRAKAILAASFVRRRFRHTWAEQIPWQKLTLTVSLLMFLTASTAFWGLVTGRFSFLQTTSAPEQVREELQEAPPAIVDMGAAQQFFSVKFPDAQQEKAIRNTLGKQEEDILSEELSQVTQLHFCGNMVLKTTNGVEFDADKNWRVNGARVLEGSVEDLQLIGKLSYLEGLSLVYQPVSDVSALHDLVLLKELNLAGTKVTSLDSLTELPSLEVLNLQHTQITDLRPLENLPRLKTVAVSRDMLPLTWSGDARFEVVLTK